MVTKSLIYIYWMSDPYKLFHRNHVMIGETIYPDKILTKEEMKDKANIAKIQDVLNERIFELEKEAQKYSKSRPTDRLRGEGAPCCRPTNRAGRLSRRAAHSLPRRGTPRLSDHSARCASPSRPRGRRR